jgi:hypothetical protein
MGFPLFRFTLNNSIAGSLQISEPGGWDEAVLKLERNQEFHSLVEFYDQPLTFYGQSSNGNGGLDYIREIERSQGPDAQITILIEISQDEGVTYETVFDGLIDITSCKEVDFYKAEYGIIRNDFWQKFINRKSTPVNMGASTDVDGNAITSILPSTLTLTSQKIRQTFERRQESTFPDNISSVSFGTTNYLIWGNTNPVIDEITQRVEYGTQVSSELPTTAEKYLWKFDYAGDYAIDLNIKYYIGFGASRTYDLRWYYAYKVGGVLTGLTQIGATISGTAIDVTWSAGSPHTLSTTLTFSEGGAELYIYGTLVLSSASTGGSYFPDFDNDPGAPFDPVYTTLTIDADTTYPNTTANAYQVLNAARSIASKITGSYPCIQSDYLLSASGCGHNYAVTKGLYVRGYNTTDKPFYMSFDDWWKGFNPILCLGLGYVNGADEIEIEPRSEFYDPVPVLNLDYVNNIERSWDTRLVFKTVEVGYEKWSAESGSGIDDPQTKHTYNTRFKTVGEDIKMLSKFYAASLGIEQTRRNRVEFGKDWRLDEDLMVIALQRADNSLPELGNGPYTGGITDLLNFATRYNVRITPARNLIRWRDFLSGCLKWYYDADGLGTRLGFQFASGEGNVETSSTLASTDCEYDDYAWDAPTLSLYGLHSVTENSNITPSENYLFVPILYEFEHPLTWEEYKAIQAYRKKAIGVSRTNSGHAPCFIMNLEYQITKGKAKFTVLLGQSEPI